MEDLKINSAYNNNNPRFKQSQTRFCKFCKRSGHTIAFFFKYKDSKNIGNSLNIEKILHVIINVVGAIHQFKEFRDKTIFKILRTDTEIVLTKISPITKTTLCRTTHIDHVTHQTLQTITDHYLTMAYHRNDKETTFIAI